MQRDPAAFLWDARRAADATLAFIRGRTREDMQADLLLRSAVERQLHILGEALSQFSRLDPALASQIPDLSRIIGLRNILVHGYARVDPARVWRIIEEDVPGLRATLDRLLGEGTPPGGST